MLPPRENHDIITCSPPLICLARLAPAGWKAATPIPEAAATRAVNQKESDRPMAAIPAPASSTLTGISQRISQMSPRMPNSGCTTEETRENARTIPAAAA